MTPHHRKPHQEILVLHPKSFPKQRNSLPGQTAEVLTAKFKKGTWRNGPKKQRGLGRDQRADMGGCLGFLSPGKVVAAGAVLGESWDCRRLPTETAASLPCDGAFGAEREEQSPSRGSQRQQRRLCQRLPVFGRKLWWWLLFSSAESDSFPCPYSLRWIGLWQHWAHPSHARWWLCVFPGASAIGCPRAGILPMSGLSLKASRVNPWGGRAACPQGLLGATMAPGSAFLTPSRSPGGQRRPEVPAAFCQGGVGPDVQEADQAGQGE